jgi:hypothetical protein
MEVVYTSDSSDNSDQKTVEIAHKNLSIEEVDLRLDLDQVIQKTDIETVLLNHNLLASVPLSVVQFTNLKVLDISSNNVAFIPNELNQCSQLVTFVAKNNKLTNESFSKTFLSECTAIKEINISGNQLAHFPDQLLELTSLKYLYLGGNQITQLPYAIRKLQNLQVLHLGGNRLKSVTESVGVLSHLQALVLADNLIERLPDNFGRLKNLKSLLLHKNRLRTLPRAIIQLRNLTELSLRDNPLVVRFVQSEIAFTCPSLLELAGRAVKLAEIAPGPEDLPRTLLHYLRSANCCVNPKCKGVYFDERVEHIKFVDFCGKYRVPLLQYLCSSRCIEDASQSESSSDSDEDMPSANGYLMRKVLLG